LNWLQPVGENYSLEWTLAWIAELRNKNLLAEELDLATSPCNVSDRKVVVYNGMASAFDPELSNLLRSIQRRETNFFHSDSFARITRNPAKLLGILDHILRCGASLVTNNYVLSGTYVARRSTLIRPSHTMADFEVNKTNYTGLSAKHKELLSQVGGR